jgi:hypothetical protein
MNMNMRRHDTSVAGGASASDTHADTGAARSGRAAAARPIGGFLAFELPPPRAPYHGAALALASGRGCLAYVLEVVRPRRVHVPFWVCDAVLAAVDAAGIARSFYRLTPELLPPPELRGAAGRGEMVLCVNYFGLREPAMAAWARALAARCVIDDTHAFFRRGYAGAWSFNSARKFLGVPDGAYLYPCRQATRGGALPDRALPVNEDVRWEHLVNRLAGRQELAFRQYRASERRVTSRPMRMSPLSAAIVAASDLDRVRRARRDNFRRVHERLGARNRLAAVRAIDGLGGQVPYCYPFLPERPVDRQRLHERGVFVPTLWPEVPGRPGGAFELERDLAERLLPLPIDQRYGAAEIDDMIDRIERELARGGARHRDRGGRRGGTP